MKRQLTAKMREMLLVLLECEYLIRIKIQDPKDQSCYWVGFKGGYVNYLDELPEHWCRFPTIQALMRRGLVAQKRWDSTAWLTEHGKFLAKLLKDRDEQENKLRLGGT